MGIRRKKSGRYVTVAMMLGLAMVFSGCGENTKKEQDGVWTSDAGSVESQYPEDAKERSEDTNDSLPSQEGLQESVDLESISYEGGLEESKEENNDKNENEEVTLVMVGDILLHTPVEASAKQEDGTYDFSHIFVHMKDEISNADLALVNQEVIIGGEELGVSGYPAFNAPYEIADELVDTGFDVILHATNHAMDKGKKGILNCLSNWEEKYPEIMVTGVYDSSEEYHDILITEVDGIAIAILNYTYGTNGIELPSDMPYAVSLLKKDKVISDIQKAKELADFVVVCPHWGTEYRLEPDSSQKEWTKLFLENGVDLVIGTHPHVIEPVELLYDEETGHEMLVYYSLGNFVNWTSGTGAGVSNRMVGGMAEITIGRDENGEVSIQSYDVEAICAHVTSGFGGVTVYPISEYTDELASENEIISQAPDFSREYMIQLCDEVWGELWR